MTDANHKRLARDVAVQIERRRRRRKLVTIAIVIAAIVFAILYLGFGRGWFGGKGAGKGEGQGSGSGLAIATDAGALRCLIRITAEGITTDGKITTVAEAVAACEPRGAAEVVVTGDARQGAWDELKAALDAAQIAFYQRGPSAPAGAPDASSM